MQQSAPFPDIEMQDQPQERHSARSVTVEESDAGRRVDNFLAARLPDLPRGRIYRMLRRGEVRVNGARVRPDRRLNAGDSVRIPPHWLYPRSAQAVPPRDLISAIERRILYEDDAVLALDKPSGLAVHGGSGLRYGVIEALRHSRGERVSLALVHRLDRDTSGCLLLAKNTAVLRELHQLLRAGGFRKRYSALLKGRPRWRRRAVEAPLRRGGGSQVAVDEAGKVAVSRFIQRYLYRECVLVDVELATGRMHQIRVHAAHVGHPVAGDRKYGDPAFNRTMRRLGLKRLFLHAAELEFEWRGSGRKFVIQAPLPEELRKILDKLD
jgi:23S rRNA pseudouridine955/2504/2580 synthase